MKKVTERVKQIIPIINSVFHLTLNITKKSVKAKQIVSNTFNLSSETRQFNPINQN